MSERLVARKRFLFSCRTASSTQCWKLQTHMPTTFFGSQILAARPDCRPASETSDWLALTTLNPPSTFLSTDTEETNKLGANLSCVPFKSLHLSTELQNDATPLASPSIQPVLAVGRAEQNRTRPGRPVPERTLPHPDADLPSPAAPRKDIPRNRCQEPAEHGQS